MEGETGSSPASGHFELHQLRCFAAVAEELHFGKAAARMGMTQGPFSRQIQALERILDVKLLDRVTSRAVTLTPAGRVFLQEARGLLRMAESAILMTRRLASGESGSIAVGFLTTVGYSILPTLLLQCAAVLPQINLSLAEGVSSTQLEKLANGSIDVGLLRPPFDLSIFSCLKITDERLIAALPTGDERLEKPTLDLSAFHGKPFIMYSEAGAWHYYDLISRLFKEQGVVPKINHSVIQINTMLGLVRAGIGAALVPEATAALQFDDVHYRPVETTPIAPSAIYAVWKTNNGNPALSSFLDILRTAEGRGLEIFGKA